MQNLFNGFDPTQEDTTDGCLCRSNLSYDFTTQQWVKKQPPPPEPSCEDKLAQLQAENDQLSQALEGAKQQGECPEVEVQNLQGDVVFKGNSCEELVTLGGEASAEEPDTETPDPTLE